MQEDASKRAALNSVPDHWEPITSADPPISVGYAAFSLPNSRDFHAELNGGSLILHRQDVTLMMVGLFRTDPPTAANSIDATLQFQMANTTSLTPREMLRLSRSELRKYIAVASVKAIMTHYQNGSALIETDSSKGLVLLGAASSPEKILLSNFAKDSNMGVGIHIYGRTPEEAKAIAREIASSIKFVDKSWRTNADEELDTLAALRTWLADDAISIRRTHIAGLPPPFVVKPR